MNEIEIAGTGKIAFKPSGLVFLQELDYEDWAGLGNVLKGITGALQWWIGDWLNYGEKKYGEMYAQAIEMTGQRYSTLSNYKWVASRIEFCRRRENLSFSHHAEVAKLEDPKAQEKALDLAEKEKLTRNELRKRLKLPKGECEHEWEEITVCKRCGKEGEQ